MAARSFRFPTRRTGPGGSTLPDRVRAAIQAEQDRSEILIGWVQLAVVVTFASLYGFSPKTFAPDAAFVPVPWALAAYTVFTLARLACAYRMRLPDWFLALSIVIDVTLLLGLMWSFHVQYMQPPAFYLKMPTLLYLFIFIALRALRFEARWVLLSGGLAAVGWSMMVWYAIRTDPDVVTRDYVLYLTSNAILLGAEFDKIVAILIVTAIVAAALVRARRLLERAVADGAAARDLSRFFAPEVARHITGAEQTARPGEGQLRDAALLFLDIRDFTGLAAAMPPSDVMRLLTEYQARMVSVVRAHGGSVDKFLGDGVMASFGAARPSETFAADALRALEAVLAATDSWNRERVLSGRSPVRVNGAVAAGAVLFGAVGDEAQLEYTVIGDAVNLAAKLEKANKVEGTAALTTDDCFALACRQGYVPAAAVEVLAAREISGVASRMDLRSLGSRQ